MAGTFSGRVAYASIKYTAGVPSFLLQSGDFDPAIVDNGAGDFELTLSSPVDPSEACISLTLRGTAGTAYVKSWTDTTLQIQIEDFAGAGKDVDCDITIIVKPAN